MYSCEKVIPGRTFVGIPPFYVVIPTPPPPLHGCLPPFSLREKTCGGNFFRRLTVRTIVSPSHSMGDVHHISTYRLRESGP